MQEQVKVKHHITEKVLKSQNTKVLINLEIWNASSNVRRVLNLNLVM